MYIVCSLCMQRNQTKTSNQIINFWLNRNKPLKFTLKKKCFLNQKNNNMWNLKENHDIDLTSKLAFEVVRITKLIFWIFFFFFTKTILDKTWYKPFSNFLYGHHDSFNFIFSTASGLQPKWWPRWFGRHISFGEISLILYNICFS